MHNNNIDIVLIVDHKWRDLPGMAALAVWLEVGFGLRAKLIPYTLWQQSLLNDRPQVFVVSALTGSRGHAILRLAHEIGTRVAVIMTEGRPNNIQGMEYSVGKGSGVENADLFFAWSNTVRDFMLDQGILPDKKIVVAGAHRFDIYCPPLNQLIMSKKNFVYRYGLDENRPIVSWATNFTHAEFHIKNKYFLIKDWRKLGISRFPAYSKPLEVARFDWETRNKSCHLMRKLLQARPHIQLAVKPHPAEDPEFYKQFVKESRREFGSRVVFVGSEYIWDLLNAADIHVHRLCTTGVEAWFLNVPSIDLHIKDYLPWSLELPGAASESVHGNDLVQNFDSLVERIDYYLNGGSPTSEQHHARQNYIKRWLYKVDGCRCKEHAEALAFLLQNRRLIRYPKFNISNIPIFTKNFMTQLFGPNAGTKLRFWRRSQGGKIDRIGQVDKLISQEDAHQWMHIVRQIIKKV